MSLLFIPIMSFILLLGEDLESGSDGQSNGSCSVTGEINQSMWEESFSKAGVLKNKGNKIIKIAEEQGIDPVLFASIAFHETAWGTSNAVIEKNNPGGLMSSNGLLVFVSLDEGLEAMGVTLHNRIIIDGKNTIELLGQVYAPIGAGNDPTGLNAHWVPTVMEIVSKLGGLTKNCESSSLGTGSYIVPVDNPVVTSGFGIRWGTLHKGIDFGHPIGTPVKAADSGTVTVANNHVEPGYSGYGNVIQIQHGNEWTLYAHLSKIHVKVGQKVKQGEVIGEVGNTGDSTGPHLHFEIRKQVLGGQIDPARILGIHIP